MVAARKSYPEERVTWKTQATQQQQASVESVDRLDTGRRNETKRPCAVRDPGRRVLLDETTSHSTTRPLNHGAVRFVPAFPLAFSTEVLLIRSSPCLEEHIRIQIRKGFSERTDDFPPRTQKKQHLNCGDLLFVWNTRKQTAACAGNNSN